MKKNYSKPDILFESFSLSTDIAGGCERFVYSFSGGQCGVKYGSYVIFTTNVTGCTVKVEDGSKSYDSLCYHVPTDQNNVFNS